MAATKFSDVIRICGGASALARLLNVQVNTVQKWKDRENIPAERWPIFIAVAESKGKKLTPDILMRMAARNAPRLRPHPRPLPKVRPSRRPRVEA
jgi:DNA-binding transcriptional regulator YdaS (Cro superfamily)